MAAGQKTSIGPTTLGRCDPPRGDLKLGYLCFEVSDLPRWRLLLEDVIGMIPADSGAREPLTFTHDQYQHRIALSRGPSDDVVAVGWEAGDEATFAEVVERLAKSGTALREGSPAEREARRVERLVRFEDPDGNPLELFSGP